MKAAYATGDGYHWKPPAYAKFGKILAKYDETERWSRRKIKMKKIRHENSSGCMHGNYVYQSVSTDGTGGKKKRSCKTLCGYALKATGGAKKLKYSSAAALDFGALTHSVRSQVKTIQYVCDSKEAYSLCVMEAKNGKGAKKLYNALKKYQKANSKSDYLSDYSKTEQESI